MNIILTKTTPPSPIRTINSSNVADDDNDQPNNPQKTQAIYSFINIKNKKPPYHQPGQDVTNSYHIIQEPEARVDQFINSFYHKYNTSVQLSIECAQKIKHITFRPRVQSC